jgi:hypothetical protein
VGYEGVEVEAAGGFLIRERVSSHGKLNCGGVSNEKSVSKPADH